MSCSPHQVQVFTKNYEFHGTAPSKRLQFGCLSKSLQNSKELDIGALPTLDEILQHGAAMDQYRQDLADMQKALSQYDERTGGGNAYTRHADHQLQDYLRTCTEKIDAQGALLENMRSNLKLSESSRNLLEKQATHLWSSIKDLTVVLNSLLGPQKDGVDLSWLMERKTALEQENIGHKSLIRELGEEVAAMKEQSTAERTAHEETIRGLNRRVEELCEWQTTWHEAMGKSEAAKNEQLRQLHRRLEAQSKKNVKKRNSIA
ncbi:MAG: hypothetical protein Q9167_003940 [Letrouitia subvulpina]